MKLFFGPFPLISGQFWVNQVRFEIFDFDLETAVNYNLIGNNRSIDVSNYPWMKIVVAVIYSVAVIL